MSLDQLTPEQITIIDDGNRACWARTAPTYGDGFASLTGGAAEATLDAAGVGRGSRLLDVGTGPGTLIGPALRRGATVVALDLTDVDGFERYTGVPDFTSAEHNSARPSRGRSRLLCTRGSNPTAPRPSPTRRSSPPLGKEPDAMIDLIFIKYTRQGARVLLEEGCCARRTEVQRVAELYGDRVAGYWVTDEGDWDVVFVLEGPDNADHPASGAVANLRGGQRLHRAHPPDPPVHARGGRRRSRHGQRDALRRAGRGRPSRLSAAG